MAKDETTGKLVKPVIQVEKNAEKQTRTVPEGLMITENQGKGGEHCWRTTEVLILKQLLTLPFICHKLFFRLAQIRS